MRLGARCWISDSLNFRPKPDAPDLTPGTIVALGDRIELWVSIRHRCVLVDRRALIFSKDYRTRRGKWVHESDSRVRPYLLFKLDEARSLDGSGSSSMSARADRIRACKHALRRNGWFADDLPDD
jgi:hypothetical protein